MMFCLRYFIPLLLLPFPIAPPSLVFLIFVAAILLHRPCVYCTLLTIGFLFASCSFNLAPANSALDVLTTRCWLSASSLSAVTIPKQPLHGHYAQLNASEFEVTTNASAVEVKGNNATVPAKKRPLNKLMDYLGSMPMEIELFEGSPLSTRLYWGLSSPPKRARFVKEDDEGIRGAEESKGRDSADDKGEHEARTSWWRHFRLTEL